MAIEIAQNLDAINMVRAQQNVVGRSVIGGAGAVGGGNLIGQGKQTDILTSIQLISEKTFKAIKQQTDTLVRILEFDKKKDRREKEQRAEDKKESKTIGTGIDKKPLDDADGGKEIGGNFSILQFLGIGSLLTNLKKFFAPLGLFVAKIGKVLRLGGLFGRLGLLFAGTGPLAIIAGALFLLFKYSKEISAALAPAVEGLKQAFDYLKPVFDIILGIGDVIIKTGILAIGTSLTLAFETLALVIGTVVSSVEFVYNLLKGIVTGDMDLIANAFTKVRSTFASLGDRFINAIKSLYNGIIDALPLPDKIKNKIKLNIDEKAQQQADVGNVGAATNIKEMAKERPEFIGSDGKKQLTFGEAPTKDKPTPDSKKSLFTSSAAYGDDTPKFSDVDVSKVKTKNIDDTSSASSAVTTKIVAEKSSAPQIKKYDIDLTSPIDKLESEMQSYEKRYGFKRSNALFGDTERGFYERQKQQNSMGLGTSSTVYDDFKKYQSLVASQIVRTGDESDVGMLEQASGAKFDDFFDSEGNRLSSEKLAGKLGKKDVAKKDLVGDTGSGSGGTVITDAKQTIVTNSNTTRQDTYVGGIDTSNGDNYFDRQTGSYAT
jgi:hypothetical protein